MSRDKLSLVLIRGLLRESRHWGKFTQLLQTHFPFAEILTPDLPGNGRFYQQTSPDSIQGMTDTIRAQVASKKPVCLIAISMGGMIAIDWMLHHSETVQSAVLINSSIRPVSPFYHRLRWQNYPAITKMLLQSDMDKEKTLLALTSNRFQRDQALLDQWRKWQGQHPVSAASAINQLWAAARFKVTAKPSQPLLIIASRSDRLVDYRCSLRLHQIWNSHFFLHETAGHDLPLDAPEWLISKIQPWLMKMHPDWIHPADIISPHYPVNLEK